MRCFTALSTACAMLVATAPGLAAPPPRFEAPRIIAPAPRAESASAAADNRGGQLLLAAGYDGVTLLTRGFPGSWQAGELAGLAAGQVFEPVSVAAAGDGAAAMALTQFPAQPGPDGRTVRVWLRDPFDQRIEDAGTVAAGADQEAFQPAVGVDADGRVVAAFLTVARDAPTRPIPVRVAIAVREPGGGFGPAQPVSASGAGSPRVGMSPGGRAVVVWTRGQRVEALSVEHGHIGRPVTLGREPVSADESVIAMGSSGEAVVAWPRAGPRNRGQRIVAVTRGRTGRFRRPVLVGDTPLLLGDRPAVAVARDGRAVVAWGSRVVVRGAAPRRGPRCDRIEARIASTVSGRLGALRHVDCAPNASGPTAAAAGSSVLLAWTVREHVRGPRAARSALARDGSISRPAFVGDMHGPGSQTVLALSRGPTGASLVWLDIRAGLPRRLVGADATRLG